MGCAPRLTWGGKTGRGGGSSGGAGLRGAGCFFVAGDESGGSRAKSACAGVAAMSKPIIVRVLVFA